MLDSGRFRWVVGAVALVATLALAVPAAAQTAPSYGMDETSGTVMAGSGGAPNGAISGDVTLGAPGVTAGGYGFNLNVGTCDSASRVTGTGFVQIPSSPVFSVGTQPFSFSVWLNTTSVPAPSSGATKNCDFDVLRRASRWKLELLPRGVSSHRYGAPHCQWKGVLNGNRVSVDLSASDSDVTDGTWHQITCARTAVGEQITVDGVVEAVSNVQVGAVTSTAPIYVARNPAGDDFFRGRLDDVAFTVG